MATISKINIGGTVYDILGASSTDSWETVLAEMSVNADEEQNSGWLVSDSPPVSYIEGDTYRATVDGVEYTLTAFAGSYSTLMIGSDRYDGDTEYDFQLGNEWFIFATSGTHTVKIEHLAKSVTQVEPKYLYDFVIKVDSSDGINASSPVTVESGDFDTIISKCTNKEYVTGKVYIVGLYGNNFMYDCPIANLYVNDSDGNELIRIYASSRYVTPSSVTAYAPFTIEWTASGLTLTAESWA